MWRSRLEQHRHVHEPATSSAESVTRTEQGQRERLNRKRCLFGRSHREANNPTLKREEPYWLRCL